MFAIRSFTECPLEFELAVDNGKILNGEWRNNIQGTEAGYTADCYYNPVNIDATRPNAINLLASCRYTPDTEIAIMRLPDDDPIKIEHEAFIARVKQFVDEVLK